MLPHTQRHQYAPYAQHETFFSSAEASDVTFAMVLTIAHAQRLALERLAELAWQRLRADCASRSPYGLVEWGSHVLISASGRRLRSVVVPPSARGISQGHTCRAHSCRPHLRRTLGSKVRSAPLWRRVPWRACSVLRDGRYSVPVVGARWLPTVGSATPRTRPAAHAPARSPLARDYHHGALPRLD